MATSAVQSNCGAAVTDGGVNCDLLLSSIGHVSGTVSPNTTAELESLQQALHEKENQLLVMENACLRETERQVELEDSVIAWQDKYDRLYESHKRVQKVNQSLEDKLLKMVDRNTGERAQLTSDVATLSVRLAQANFNIAKLQREIERYKADMSLAIQLLQCKPESFMSHKISSLPIDVQSKVSAYMRLETNSHSDSEGSGVGIATSSSYKVLPASESPPPAPCPFPPTAMVYSMRGLDAKNSANSALQHQHNASKNNSSKDYPNQNSNSNNNINNNNNNTNINNNIASNNNNNNISESNPLNSPCTDPDLISPLVMAKFLEHELKADEVKHCDTCQCARQDLTVLADVSRFYTVATQTPFQLSANGSGSGSGLMIGNNLNESISGQLCMRCHSNLNSPSRTNSPYLTKVVKSSDSVISETKSSVSDLNDVDKLFTPPAKKDDLMVNPILGHHRLCDRTGSGGAAVAAIVPIVTASNPPSSKTFDSKSLKLGTSSMATMLYPTTHLGAYEAEKYLLETSTLASFKGHLRGNTNNNNNNTNSNSNTNNGNGNAYQRRFLDGGGSALELLNGNVSQFGRRDSSLEMGSRYDGLIDEDKPLLGSRVSRLHIDRGEQNEALLEEALKSPTSTCSANDIIHKKLDKSMITGSTNSLWSRTSNCNSAKMFENFNRNLIRTIKSENPRYRGPRLCAMRIQRTENGQSNVLLDNMESLETVKPVLYRRRERLLDEELDDTKDIITSKSPAISSVNATEGSTSQELEAVEALSVSSNVVDANLVSSGVDISAYIDSPWTKGNDGNRRPDFLLDHEHGVGKSICEVRTTVSNGLSSICEQDNKTVVDVNGNEHLRTHVDIMSMPNFTKTMLKRNAAGYEALRYDASSKNSINSKSCTQSSSISEAIDLQESVILRRQQLSRVAEWVQNNTQQLEEQQQQKQETLSSTISPQQQCDSSGTDRQSSFSTLDQLDSVSIEKLSMDSGYKTTPQAQANGGPDNGQDGSVHRFMEDSTSPKIQPERNKSTAPANTPPHELSTRFQRCERAGDSTACANAANTTGTQQSTANDNEKAGDDSDDVDGCDMPTPPEQPTCDILNYKYYPCERDKSRVIDAELHMTTTSVDIAQMEYNVKQFLLKQNEWSLRKDNRGQPMAIATTATAADSLTMTTRATVAATATAVASVITAAAHRPKGIKRSKLFSGIGVGPGVGERVRTAMPTTTAATNVAAKQAPPSLQAELKSQLPQRTETNL